VLTSQDSERKQRHCHYIYGVVVVGRGLLHLQNCSHQLAITRLQVPVYSQVPHIFRCVYYCLSTHVFQFANLWLAVLSLVCFAATFVVTILCYQNFGRGLKEHLLGTTPTKAAIPPRYPPMRPAGATPVGADLSLNAVEDAIPMTQKETMV